jgi:DMSO/TMAO reductase YedYZ heme-binding membrane subunit
VYAYWIWHAEAHGKSLMTADKSGFKPLLFMICLLPAIWFLGRLFVTHAIPNNDIANLPVGYQQRYLGDWAVYLLIISLALRPLREITGVNKIARYSRMLGLFAFFYACLHVVNYVWFEYGFHWVDIWHDIVDRPAIVVGIIAFLMLIPLAATSTNDMVRKLGGKRWKALHRTVYIIDLLVILHFVLVTDGHYFLPALLGASVVMLLGYRLRKSRGYQSHGARHIFEHWLLEIRPDLSAGGTVRVSAAPPPRPEPTDDFFEIRPILEQDDDPAPKAKPRKRTPRAPEEATET